MNCHRRRLVASVSALAAIGLTTATAFAQTAADASQPAPAPIQGQATMPPQPQLGPSRADPPPPAPLTAEDLARLREEMLQNDGATQLTPGEIGAIRDRNRDTQRALTYPSYDTTPPPIGQRREIQVSPSPNSPPYPLTLWKGMVTAVTFLDRTGNPWPVLRVSRDPAAFALNGEGCNTGGNSQSEVQAGEGDRVTTITVMPCAFWSWGNIVVSLDGMTAPIIFQVASGANQGYAAAVDMGVTVRLPGASPMKPQRPAGYAAAPDDAAGFRPDSALSDFLNGTPPKAARSAKVVGGGDAAAWIYGGALYLRGSFTVVNPVHQARAAYGELQVWRFDQPVSRILVKDRTGTEQIITLDF
jgi:intracellular multiplication protein IcmK